ncbi:MAG: hypothetical protein ACRDH9_09970 [Actinomycetota bacterium]
MLVVVLLIGPWSNATGDADAQSLPQIQTDLLTEYSITAVPVTPADGYTPSISRDAAIASALDEMPIAEGRPAVASLVFFGDSQYGPDAGHTGNISSPYYSNRPAWLIVFPAVDVPAFGRWGSLTVPSVPGAEVDAFPTYTANLVVFMDAGTGAFLEAVTL